jgi:chromosome segregation ATPase
MRLSKQAQALERLHQLEAKQCRIETRLAGLEDRIANMELRLAQLESDHAKLRCDLASTDVAIVKRIEQTENTLSEFRDDITVNIGAVDAMARANRRTLH